MAQRKKRPVKDTSADVKKAEQDRLTARKNAMRLLAMVATTAVVFSAYRFLVTQYYFDIVLIAYMVIAAAVTFAYVIYNRGFSRRGVTMDMLPADWSDEKKREFIENGELRLKKSRPLLILIVAFAFTFVIDILELVALPLLLELVAK